MSEKWIWTHKYGFKVSAQTVNELEVKVKKFKSLLLQSKYQELYELMEH